MHYIHPKTKEIITSKSPKIKNWAEGVEKDPPEYDPQNQSCFYIDDDWVVIDLDPYPNIEEMFSDALDRIDEEAQKVKLKHSAKLFHSIGATYQTKYKEALKYKDTGEEGPYIVAEKERKDVDISEVVDGIIKRAEEWQTSKESLNPKIEAERTGGKEEVRKGYKNNDKKEMASARDSSINRLRSMLSN